MSSWDCQTPDEPLSAVEIVGLDDIDDVAIVPLAVSALGCDITLSAVRAILDELPFAIYSTDADGRIAAYAPAPVGHPAIQSSGVAEWTAVCDITQLLQQP